MAVNVPLINGKRHSWASIRLNILGITIIGVSEINYGQEDMKENHFGAGRYVVDRGDGNVTPDPVNFILRGYEYDRIMAALPPGSSIGDIPAFDIPVIYIPTGSDQQVKHVIRGFQFMRTAHNNTQGNTKVDVNITGICALIDYNPI